MPHYGRVLTGGVRGADAYLDTFEDFDVELLRLMTGKRIESLILDIDACLAPPYAPLLERNITHVRKLLGLGLGIGINSNCMSGPRLEPLYELNIPSFERPIPKPLRENFLTACKDFGFDPTTTWMVGDDPSTDGGAVGVLEGMAFVKPIPGDYSKLSSKKKIMVMSKQVFRSIAILATTAGNSNIIRSEDLRARAA